MPFWTTKEVARLRALHALPIERLARELPRHSAGAIEQRLSRFHLRSGREVHRSELIDALKAHRQQQARTQTDVAADAGLDRSVLSQHENGHRGSIQLFTLERWAAALGLKLVLVPMGDPSAS